MRPYSKKKININYSFDRNFLYLILFLVVFGLVFIADISAPQALNVFGDKLHYLKSQIVSALLGLFFMIVVSFIDYKIYKKLAKILFIGSLILLIAVLIPGIGYSALGARRWIHLFNVNFQPSEIIKLTLAIYLAKLSEVDLKNDFKLFIPYVLVAGLVMLQPDLGTTLVISMMALSQIFIMNIQIIHFFGSLILGGLMTLGLILISPYRRDRLFTFFESAQDPLGKSYHIRQILFALGSGGFFGVGLGQSKQKYLFLPEASTDSIFAAISEEIGFFGSAIIIIVFMYFIYKGFSIAYRAPDTFSKVLATGIIAWIGGQIFINISSMVALTPLTGIPLPFFSFGGTSLVMILIGCGILLNISKYQIEPKIDRRAIRR